MAARVELVYIVNPRVRVLRAKPAVSWGRARFWSYAGRYLDSAGAVLEKIEKNIFEVKRTR